jgi:hypothetical protein
MTAWIKAALLYFAVFLLGGWIGSHGIIGLLLSVVFVLGFSAWVNGGGLEGIENSGFANDSKDWPSSRWEKPTTVK